MKHISIIVPRGVSVVDTIIAPYNLFKMANDYHKKINGLPKPLFTIDLVGLTNDPITYQGLFTVKPTNTITSLKKTDLIIISPISGNIEKAISENMEYVDWIRNQRIINNADLASLCRGAFLLAETGLINGKSCSTHWTVQNLFRKRYPRVNLIPDKIITEDNGIFSSGGAYSILNFSLYLIERYFGRETAIWISKMSEIDFDRINQNEFVIFSGQKDHNDNQIRSAQEYIESNYERKLNIARIAEQVHINSRSFLRRFKKATANTPLEYIQRVRIEAAKRKLESTADSIMEIMFSVGYNDEKAFRKTFKRHAGLSPKEYHVKYNKEAAFA